MAWLGIGSEVKVAGEGVKSALDSVGGLAKSLRTAITGKNPDEEAKLEQMFAELDDKINAGQQALNMIAAQSTSFFQSGWRPAAGWLGVIGLTYSTLGQPMLIWLSDIFGIPKPPVVDTGILVTLLIQMLGLGTLRTYERQLGVEKN